MKPDGDLLATIAALGPGERRVLGMLARRMLEWQRRCGRLDLAADGRDWRHERGEALADALLYGAIGEMAALLASEDAAGRAWK